MEAKKTQKLISPGKWFAEFDENGNPGETHYDISYRRLLGFESEDEFKDSQTSWQDALHPDDRERVNAYFDDVMKHHPEGRDYDIEYRILTKSGEYRWLHDYAKISRRGDGSVLRFDGVSFDIQDIKDYESQRQHDDLLKEVMDYILNHDDDPIELLKEFAEKIRVLIDCDQVIYRDLEETRIMVNSPAIEDTWSVPIDYCMKCQHFDAHHPMYRMGYTEMDNCQEGWQGIPVYHKCPIKSSLTRIVYCDGKVAGYLAIHYVQKYHHFTDIERKTLEEFTRNLSLILSRYEANKAVRRLRQEDEEKRKNLLHQMAGDDGVFIVDCVKNTFKTIHDRKSGVLDYGTEGNYSDTIDHYIDLFAADADKEMMHKMCAPEYILARMKEENEFRVKFRDTLTGSMRFAEMRVVRLSDNEVMQSFSDCDEATILAHVNEKVMADFASVFILDLENDTYRFLCRNSDSGFKDVPGGCYSETIQEYISRVNPEYRDRWKYVCDAKSVRDLLTRHKRIEYVYPLEGIEKRWRRCTLQLLDSLGGVPMSAIMTYFIIDDATAKNLELENMLAQQKKEAEESQHLIDSFVTRYNIAYVINLNDDSFTLLRMDDDILGSKEKFNNFTEAKTFFIDVACHPADRKRMKKEMEYKTIRKKVAESRSYDVEYRALVNGVTIWHTMTVTAIGNDDVAIGFVHNDVEITRRHFEHKRYEEFFALFVVDMDNNTVKVVKNQNKFDKAVEGKTYDFTSLIINLSEGMKDEPKAFFRQRSDMDFLRKEFANVDRLSYAYQSNLTEGDPWIDVLSYVTSRHEDGTPAEFTLGFSLSDQSSVDRQKLHEQIAEQAAFTHFFFDTYLSAYYVDLKTLGCKVYKRTEKLENDYPIVDSYVDSLEHYIDTAVHPDDRAGLLDVISPDRMRAMLKEQSEYVYLFRDISEGEERMFRMQVIRGADDDHAAFGFEDITEEFNLREEQQKYAGLIGTFASKFEAVYIHNLKDGTFKVISDIRKRYEKVPEGTLYGDFLQGFVLGYVHPYDKQKFKKWLFRAEETKKALKVGEELSFEYRSNIDGEYLWHLANFHRINEDEVLCGFADCDEEVVGRIVRDKLIDEYDALYVLDLDNNEIRPARPSRVTEVGVFKKKINYKEVALKFAAIVDQQYQGDWMKFSDVKYLKEYMAKDDHREYVYVLPGAKNTLRRFTVDVLDRIDGEAKTVLLSFIGIDDIHAEKILLNAQLAEQTVQLEDALALAKTASNAKTSFLFNMSHDIRTPINAITGFTLMAKKYVDDKEKVTDYLDKIDVSGQQLLMLINQVLEMARIESGKVEFDYKPVNIKESYEVLVTVLSEQAGIKGLEFTHDLADIKHFNVLADDTRMSQITLNLVGNAIKYTQEGGKVDFLLKEVPARKEGCATYIFTVADTGIGMSEEFLTHIFEPFSRENSTTVSKIQGTGLGMAIVKNLVDLAGGIIEVHSELGKGTRFDVTMDFKINEVESTANGQQSTEADDEDELIHFKGKKILLVEDNELNREIARFLLEDLGMDVYEATDGTYAVEEIKSVIDRGEPNYYDLILMDIQMPMMDGYEATRQIRDLEATRLQDNETTSRIPIIAVSANAFAEDKQKSLDAGMDGHIAKPIDVAELMGTMAKYL